MTIIPIPIKKKIADSTTRIVANFNLVDCVRGRSNELIRKDFLGRRKSRTTPYAVKPQFLEPTDLCARRRLLTSLQREPSLIPTSSLQVGRTHPDQVESLDETSYRNWLGGPSGRFGENTQIYEGTNQIQRVVIAKHLLK